MKLYREMTSFEKLNLPNNTNKCQDYQVIEDNAGGLYLFIFNDDGECIYAHSGYQHCEGQIREDLIELESGGNASDWDGCEDNPQKYYNSIDTDGIGFNVIVDNNQSYFDAMGLSGQSEFPFV